jgi:transposase
MEDLSDSERGQIVGGRIPEAPLTQTATSGVSRAIVSTVMSAYINHGKTTSAKRKCGRKSKLTEGDRRILRKTVSKNRRTTAAQVTAEMNMYTYSS